MDGYWCGRCGQHMDPTDEYYCSDDSECLSGNGAPIFTSVLNILPSNASFSAEVGPLVPNPKATSAKLMQMPETTSPRFQNVPPLPFDILLYILDCVQHSDLPALCRVSKTFHDCASNILYRSITAVNILDVCKTLSQSPGLAARVKHFELTPASREKIIGAESEFALVGNALRYMTRLRSLKLTMGEAYSHILALCTAQIQSFQCSFRCSHHLIRFLHSQPELTTLKLWRDLEGQCVLSTCVPKLMKLDAPLSWLTTLIPGRPVKEVVFHERRLVIPTIDITFLVSSLSPIRTLVVGSPFLLALNSLQIKSILPVLEKLTITTLHIGTYFHDSETTSFGKWLQELFSALPALTSVILVSTKRSFSWIDQDTLSFVETAVRFAPNVDIFIMESPYYSQIRSTWRRVDGKWGLSHREQQGVSQQERRMQWEQRKRESRIQRTKRTQPAVRFLDYQGRINPES